MKVNLVAKIVQSAHLVERTKGTIVSKSCNISKTLGGVHPPPPPLVPRWGYEFACTSEGDKYGINPGCVKTVLGKFYS